MDRMTGDVQLSQSLPRLAICQYPGDEIDDIVGKPQVLLSQPPTLARSVRGDPSNILGL